ncbi:MAG: ribonuclease HII [Candidatus Methanomethylicota archaeon]|uniref:Ribonuclease HII n=1 Tax=Thermoproteota archaeon TaxID=2056631 RepID=A0A497EQ09_9CREN|nr:MAG: ribonuclease HII [Candidatus Verstraetearchaeota archaeon]
MRVIAGIDEVGRGPVIGPMVIAGVSIASHDLEKLKLMGVKDSKKLTHPARIRLAEEIKKIAIRYELVEIPVEVIDRNLLKGVNLNMLEAKFMALIIEKLKPDEAYIGSVDVNADRFKKMIEQHLTKLSVKLNVSHHAEDEYPVVAAASILAKCRREEIINELKQRVGDFGSGYPHDPKTKEFLIKWVKEHGALPPFARKTWKTSKKALQLKLNEALI